MKIGTIQRDTAVFVWNVYKIWNVDYVLINLSPLATSIHLSSLELNDSNLIILFLYTVSLPRIGKYFLH